MANHDPRVAIYARVSGEQQAKEDTIASQLEAVAQRLASDALECDPELRFVDDGYSAWAKGHMKRPGIRRNTRRPTDNAFVHSVGGTPRIGRNFSPCWTAIDWDSVYFSKPSAPLRRPTPDSFIPPIGMPTVPNVAA